MLVKAVKESEIDQVPAYEVEQRSIEELRAEKSLLMAAIEIKNKIIFHQDEIISHLEGSVSHGHDVIS